MSQSVQIEPDATSTIAQDADGRLVAVSHHLGNLLRAFHSVLEAVDGLPIAPVVPSDYRRSGIASRLHALPRPRWLLRYFVVVHIHFVVNVSLVPQLGVIGWYRVNRELRDLGYAHGSGRLGHFPPGHVVGCLLGDGVPDPPACQAGVPRIRSGGPLQGRGLRRLILSGAAALLFLLGALVAPLLVIFPVAALYFGYLQARLNKTWAKQGTPMVAASQF